MQRNTKLSVGSLCRTCAKNFTEGEEPLIPLFYGAAKNIIKEQYQTDDFHVHFNDGLPQQICSECLDQLNDINEFFEMCARSHTFLYQNFLNPENPDNENIPPNFEEYMILNDGGGVGLHDDKDDFDIATNNEFKIEILDETDCYEDDKIFKVEEEIYNDIDKELELLMGSNERIEQIDEFDNNSSYLDTIDLKETKIENDSDSDDYFVDDVEKDYSIPCRQCPQICESYEDLQHHMKNSHKYQRNSSSVLCEICGEDVKLKHLKLHRSKHIGVITPLFTCQYCDKKFEFETSYKGHMYKHLIQMKPKYRCEHCGKGYMVQSKLQLHIKTNHIEGVVKKKRKSYNKPPRASIKCPFCMKHFLNTVSLVAHCKTHRKPDIKDTKHICSYCEIPFKRADHLKIHVNTVHLKSDRFECKYCDRVFYASFILNSHVKKEHLMKPERPKCDVCNKSLSSAQCVARHKLEAHSTGKHYECPICEEKFRKRVELIRHSKVHDVIIENEHHKEIIIKEFCENAIEKK